MENAILLEKILQIITKCQSSPVYSDLKFEKHQAYKNSKKLTDKILGTSYSVNITNTGILYGLATNSGNVHPGGTPTSKSLEDSLSMNVTANKISKEYKILGKIRPTRYSYSIIIKIENDFNYNSINGITTIPNYEEYNFTEDESMCKKVYESLESFYKNMNDAKANKVIRGLDVIIDHNLTAKREIGIDKLMEDE